MQTLEAARRPPSQTRRIDAGAREPQRSDPRHSNGQSKGGERLLGRLINVAQVLPELKPFLRGGYRATAAAWARTRGYHPPQLAHLARGSEAFRLWLGMLEAAHGSLRHNAGSHSIQRHPSPASRRARSLARPTPRGWTASAATLSCPRRRVKLEKGPSEPLQRNSKLRLASIKCKENFSLGVFVGAIRASMDFKSPSSKMFHEQRSENLSV